MERPVSNRLLLALFVAALLVLVVAFAGASVLTHRVCIAAQIADANSVTTYPVQCQ